MVDISFEHAKRFIPNGYEGLDWTNFGSVRSAHEPATSGYQTGLTSGIHVGTNPYGRPAEVSVPAGSFDVKSLNMTAAWDLSLTVDIYGYKDGEQLYHRTVTIDDSGPLAVKLNFNGVEDVIFAPSTDGEVHDPNSGGFGGPNIAFDDMIVRNIVPTAGEGIHGAFTRSEDGAFRHHPAIDSGMGHGSIMHPEVHVIA